MPLIKPAEDFIEALRKVLSKDRCVEFTYFPRRNEVMVSVDVEEGIGDGEFFAIYGVLKELGFEDFWIDGGSCDVIEDRYTPPEIKARAKEAREDLVEFIKKKGGRFIVCGR